jgi:NADPH:quinone reductase
MTMKAIGLTEFGGPEVLKVIDLPEPEPGPGEVRIRIHAVAVNPTDITFRSGARAAQLADRAGPYIPGMDAAGVVDKLGEDSDGRLAVGDPVIAYVIPFGPHGGSYAEKVVVAAASVVPAPAGASFPEASTLLLNATTARLSLDALALPPGATVAVVGGAGAVGGYAIQLAKADGLTVLADVAPSDDKQGLDRAERTGHRDPPRRILRLRHQHRPVRPAPQPGAERGPDPPDR